MTRRKRSASDENDIVKKPVAKKKEKVMVIDQDTVGYYFLRYEGGGEVPKAISGRYIRYDEAKRAVDTYIGSK